MRTIIASAVLGGCLIVAALIVARPGVAPTTTIITSDPAPTPMSVTIVCPYVDPPGFGTWDAGRVCP